jgi:uncharacterized phage protein gp47/JayE
MADLPTPQSYEQILGDMLSAYAAKLGINDFNVGSVNTSFFEVVALAVARASGDVFQILKDYSVDRASGDTLKRLATENNVTPIAAQPSTGAVNVIDTSFTKISTQIYSGANPPNIGSTMINVSDASLFPAAGSIYIGRGTPNVEGPLPYTTAPTQTGGYWVITLTSPTTKFHNLAETVVLAQGGNRTVGANTIVLSPGVGSTSDIQYSVTTQAVVLDGETEVDGVPIAALIPGAAGNVPAGAIKTFATPPFPGATVTNPLPLTTGADSETDDQLRVRVKNALASTGLGTATAVKAALIGATSDNGQYTIVSDSLQINTDGSATVYVDDGSGYEATSAGVGIESIVNSAIGGEQFFALQTGGTQAPVAKAFLQSTQGAPFALAGGDTLAVIVGGVTYQHTFATTDFRSPNGATAYEVTASINGDTTLGFEATTAGGGVYVVIRAKAETHDDIQTTVPTVTSGRDASIQMGFPSNLVETLRLYKNNIPLSKDGSTASVFSQAQALWSATIANGDTLVLSVDGTSQITYTILNTDFIATGLYTSVSSTNSLSSWVQVLNNKLTGVTVSIVGQQLEITSNLEDSNRAQVVIDPSSTLVTKGMFSSSIGLSSQGAASDFTLDRNTAQFQLVVPLVKGDVLSAGTLDTEGTLTSAPISGGSITFTSDAHAWMLIDSPGAVIPTGVASNTNLSVSTPSTNVVRYTSTTAGAFSNVLPGDYLIVWSAELPPTDRLEGRVYAVTGTTLDILVTPAEWAAVVVTAGVLFLNGFVVCRTANVPQKFKVAAGTYTLDQIAQALQAQTADLVFSVSQEEFLIVETTTLDSTGSVMVVTADTQGQLMNFPLNDIDDSKTSLIAFYDSGDYQAELPLFIHAPFGAGSYADPIDSYITSVTSSISLAGRDPNELIAFLHPYGTVRDAQPYGENVQETTISGTTIGIANQSDVRRVRSVDRFFLANPLDFGHNDTAVVVLDNNPSGESFTIPFYRRSIANSTYAVNQYNFNAYDVDSGATASFTSQFPGFDFSNFKALMQAKKVLKPSAPQTGILYRATQWGRSGEKVTVGYVYPSAPNAVIGNSIIVGTTVAITISLGSGIAVTSAITASTQWNITVTPNTPTAGIDQVTYTYNGTGTPPSLSLSGGEYVNILPSSGFNAANDGIFRVSTQAGFTPTANSFSVQAPSGTAVAETNALTGVNNAITFYEPSTSTAAQVQAYVTANLGAYITAQLVNDGGATGAGVIALSTYEDSGFAYQNIQLQDGINWIASSNVGGSPQFAFKRALAYYTDGPASAWYAFNNNAYGASTGGEEVRFIPTTMDQVRRLISILAVTGFSTLGNINLVDRGERLELTTQTLGSLGAIQIIGGTGNEYSTPIVNAAERLDNTYMTASVNNVAGQGIHSDQWFRLQADQAQNKIVGFSSNSSVTTINNSPTAGESTVQMLNRTLTQRYFGQPRHMVRTQGDTFRVEKQGDLVCISWTGVGTNPNFVKSPLNFNDTSGGTYNFASVPNTTDFQLTILTGNANFTELSIGDLITIAGQTPAGNNGTFLVTGVSDNGKTIQLTNPSGTNVFSSGTFTFNTNAAGGDTFTVGATVLTAGTYASYSGTIAGTSTPVTLTANTLGTIGNSIALSFSGTNSIISAIATWNIANPANQVTLTSGDGTQIPTVQTVTLSGGVNGNFAVGATAGATASNLAATIAALPQVTTTSVGSVVTVFGTFVGQTLALAYTGTHVTVSGPFIVGMAFTAGQFSASSGVSEGDTVIIGPPFNILNQGRYRVIREYNNSIWLENSNVVEEEVSLPYNPINLEFDSTTSFMVSAANNSIYLSWNGVGTEPQLENANMGDIVTFGTDFSSGNQGSFMVTSSGAKLNSISNLAMPTGAQLSPTGAGNYFEFWSASNATKYYVWFKVNGINTDPAPGGGFTGIEVDVLSGDTAASIASKAALAITGIASAYVTPTTSGSILILTLTGFSAANDPLNVTMPAPFSVSMIQEGRTTFLQVINPSAVNQSAVFVNNILQDHRPQMQFSEYEATVPGDLFGVAGTVIGASNTGTYSVVQTLSRTSVVVKGSLSSVTNVSLNGNETAIYVREGVPYSGYKHVFLVSAQPGTTTLNELLFDTNAQYPKINSSANVEMTSLGKMNFPTTLRSGLDSYRYNTGLIAEANRIIYGDPRDAITYPGVGAAGADIFVREPLAYRIQVAVDVRLLTGAPFSNVSQQVRSSIASLINSNPVGVSIDISSIVGVARAVPGVISVAVSSPQYDPTHDLITLVPSQKAIIIDPTTDISVDQIGS